MKKQSLITILFTVLMSMVGANAFAYDIEVENADGVIIYYNYINDNKELEVTNNGNYNYQNDYYIGDLAIPEEVTFMNRTRKVTSIGISAFYDCTNLSSITIPNNVTTICDEAFAKSHLRSIIIGNGVLSIGNGAFSQCEFLESVAIPNSVNYIGKRAFYYCSALTTVNIPSGVTIIEESTFENCRKLNSVTIPNSLVEICSRAFCNCYSITSISLPNSVTSIGSYAFAGSGLNSIIIPKGITDINEGSFQSCVNLETISIPNSVKTIGNCSFDGCPNISALTIPSSVISIGDFAFCYTDLPTIVSKIENPFEINNNIFNKNTYINATLYVPDGTLEKYRITEGWKDFVFIEEGTGPDGGEAPETKKCATPTIGYQNGKLVFNCDTEGATCQYTITDDDIKSGSSNEVQLSVTYNISVYATKDGFENSDVATATLCWIDVEPKTEGITNIVSNVRARAVLIQSNGNQLTISGAEEGSTINVFDMSGRPAGSAKASAETTTIYTTLRSGDVGIVKFSNSSVKVLFK